MSLQTRSAHVLRRLLVAAFCAFFLAGGVKGDSPIFAETKIGTVPGAAEAGDELAGGFVSPPNSAIAPVPLTSRMRPAGPSLYQVEAPVVDETQYVVAVGAGAA